MPKPPAALFIHGKPSLEKFHDPRYPSPADDNWLPAASRRFQMAGFDVYRPQMPRPYAPDMAAWQAAYDRYADLLPGSYQCGLSLGAGFLAYQCAMREDVEFGHIDLVAPHLDPDNKYGFMVPEDRFKSMLGRFTASIFYDTSDSETILRSVDLARVLMPQAELVPLPHGHFLWRRTERDPEPNMKLGTQFTELTIPESLAPIAQAALVEHRS